MTKIGKWTMESKEFKFHNINNILVNWEACMVCGSSRSISLARWCLPLEGVLKFNVDGASRGKLGPAGIGGVLHNFKGGVLISFSNPIGIKNSN